MTLQSSLSPSFGLTSLIANLLQPVDQTSSLGSLIAPLQTSVPYDMLLSGTTTGAMKTGTPVPTEYIPFIKEASQTYGVPPERIAAMIMAESSFRPNLRGSSGEYGLTQMMPTTMPEVGLALQNAFDPRSNIMAGTQYLRRKYDEFKNWDLAHAAYNAGSGGVRRAGLRIPQNKYTPTYIRNINAYVPWYKQWMQDNGWYD